MIKLIALDSDGTLTNSDKKITERTKNALLEMQRRGSRLVLASGRPLAGLLREASLLQMDKYDGYLIAYNGGKITTANGKEIIFENSIPQVLARDVLLHLRKYPVNPIVDDGTAIITTDADSFSIAYESRNNNLAIKIVNSIVDAVDFDPVKILIAAPQEILEPVIEEIRQPFANTLSFIRSTPFYLEVTAKGIDKGMSLARLCEHLKIEQDVVMAFGDADNDKTMLEYAGVGIAMGNSCESLKKIADEITLSNNDDGIAIALGKHMEKQLETTRGTLESLC